MAWKLHLLKLHCNVSHKPGGAPGMAAEPAVWRRPFTSAIVQWKKIIIKMLWCLTRRWFYYSQRFFFFLSGITKSSWEMSVHLGQKFSHRVFQVWWKSNTRALVCWMEGSLPQTNMPGRGRGSASHGEVLGQNILVSTLGISTWTHENCVWCIVTTAFKIQVQWALPSSQLCVRARLA